MNKTVDIQNLDPNSLQLQNYSPQDESLITNRIADIAFDPTEDYVEYFILDLNDNVLFSDTDGYPRFQLVDNKVTLDPVANLEIEGFTEGQYKVLYNFLKRKLLSSPYDPFFIQDISGDRTELRLNTTKISNQNVVDLTNQFANQMAIYRIYNKSEL